LPADGKLRLGIRPENIVLVPEGGMPGAIYGAENHGAEIVAVIDAAGHKLRATVPAKTPTALNQPVQIDFMQDKLHFFHPQSGENLRPG
jgi:sn-glycerol 3-phosphate transport system ATP-binding protein